ncbi:Protein bark beetle like protein [Argiope bruennichi]|uniref:Protein bark beetle like protein n=1 Tax=Argiope bruennichi TaxID=94029 RepID=A0A8T0ENN9_ARGBR|nr:Protein bark beetle like protein [Argiope bruennichi]
MPRKSAPYLWAFLLVIVNLQKAVFCRTTEFGGYVSGRVVLDPLDSPFEVRKDVIIEGGASLIIRPGVELRFAPGIGISVMKDGILEAKGEIDRKITFTRLVDRQFSFSDSDGRLSEWPDVRLVDGHSVLEGRLQMFYKGKWRSVCTNSKNWTAESLHVMCRQLGFTGGHLYNWFPRNNDSSQLMYEDPRCAGSESSLTDCPNWKSRQLGSGVCDFHADIGIKCDNYLGSQKSSNWKGIHFYYGKAKLREPIENKVSRHYSLSVLEYVNIFHAGRDTYGKAVPALEVIGQPPIMNNLNLRYSAFDGINLYKPDDTFVIENSIVADNRGHGIYVNSSISQVTLSGVKVRGNGGDGVHFWHHDSYGTAPSFCDTGNIGEEQIYPVRRSHIQRREQRYVQACEQVFEVAGWTGKVLTVNFMGFSSDVADPTHASRIDVYDGPTDSSRLLASVPIINNTFPESVTSTRQKVLLKYRPRIHYDASFVVEIVANLGKAYDLNITNSEISRNQGKGIAIYEQKSGTLVNASHIIENGYLAGLHVATGSGDVLINSTFITGNEGGGVNLTHAGGFVHIDRSSIANNNGRGVAFWFNETSEHITFNHTIHITRSELVNNTLYGILMGNQCLADSFWNISLNSFRNSRDSAIYVSPCWSLNKKIAQSIVLVTHNQFLDSDYLALEASPVLHTHLLVEHNEFRGHERGVIYVSGLDDDDFSNVPAKVEIRHNYFAFNNGKFVANIGVGKETYVQELFFYKNELERNSIREAYHGLNPRSRVCAVVVVSSQNTYVYRNMFNNPESAYQLGSHVEKHQIVINATYNYWGSVRVKEVYERIFDRKDRYNLARVEFLPFLTISSDLDNSGAISDSHERDKIIPFQNGSEIGGEVPGSIFLPRGTYTVTRDIYVRPGNGRLHIEPGAILKFDRSVGMMVQGTLISESDLESQPILYTINDHATVGQDKAKIRLSRDTEGLLEVHINGMWGSVCDYGWDIVDASIACNQMGLVLHPEDWLMEQSEFDSSHYEILLSNVQCTLQDTDITLCKAETDFENSCTSKVGLRCYNPSWSGLRLGMAAGESRLRNIIVEHAGLLDFATNIFKPALQIDFNRHVLEKLKIRNNIDSGVGIMWNEVFVSESRKLTDSEFLNNHRHGLVIHTQGLNIYRCEMTNNDGSGIHYNPMFSKLEQRDLISWVNLEERNKIIRIPDDISGNIFLRSDEHRYFVFTKTKTPKKFSITTTSGRSIGVVVLNSFKETSSENLAFYGRLEITPDAPRWDVRNNLTAFPLRTPGYGMLVDYQPGLAPNGQAIIYVASVDGQRNKPVWETHPKIHIDSINIKGCKRGISSHHFNRDISDYGDHFHRYSNETILITNTNISESKAEAVYVWAPFWDPFIKNLAEINYTFINCNIKNNRKGLLHYSRDIRNSNNLFHWTINTTVFEFNEEGGVDIRLPYVWQYNENYTHSFSMHDCALRNNRKFEFSIGGHFARVNISRCLFQNNICKRGILSFSGMEKELLIESNNIKDNSAVFGIEFNLQSHANQFGLVPAYFRKNIVTNNRDIGAGQKFGYQPTSYALGIRGVQLINITRNIFENRNLQFELLTGVLTGSIDNKINVGSNWWGTTEVNEIQKRIFDFDDWNGYAIADFNPYLKTSNIDSGVTYFNNRDQLVFNDGLIGGRLYNNLKLSRRSDPYIVSSDLTIMPGVTLFIDPGVVIEFYPSVGILVLGDLVAEGTKEDPVIMKPVKIVDETQFRRQAESRSSRLCVDVKCENPRSDGFLEIYNDTTKQWVPICDARFTERNAQVVCKELGYSTLNVYTALGPRLDMGPTQTSHIRSWPHSLECVGAESALSDCEYRLNGYVDNYKCPYDRDFVYVYCGSEALPKNEDHWGGIRFSIRSFETVDSPLSRPTLSYVSTESSRLENVLIIGAGILHNEKSAAIQLVQREVQMDYITVTNSASHGIEVIGVSGSLAFNDIIIKDNMGVGVNFLSLTGESSGDADVKKLGYDPLRKVDISYGVFGMVDMCDTNKQMEIDNRILLYYKYDNQPVDCVKIFSSRHYGKQIGFRLLQFNLFDGSKYAAQPDSIKIYDGDVFNQTSPELSTIGWHLGVENITKFYVSSEVTLSVILHTVGGSGDYGFIAEVVTLPISHPTVRDSQHNISYSQISNNGKEGISYRSAGEITPAITLRYNRIDNNGRELFGNFTLGDSAILLDLQNAKLLYFYNNLIMKNQGGLQLNVDSRTAVSALKGMIVNNLFTENRNREVLKLQGRKSGAFQFITVLRNYFNRNYAQYRDTIVISQVVSNLTENMAYNNTGMHILDVQGFERMPLSYQTCERNWFWRNIATDYWDKSTIIAGKAGQRFNYNYLLNPENDFELAAKNRTYLNNREPPINAKMNWWGFNGTAAVSGRIKDYYDFEELLEVEFQPFLHDNSTVLSGKCAGGWTKIGDTCFLYVGGVMTFAEAKKFCEMDNASMPYIKTKHAELMEFVKEQQYYYQHYSDRFWIRSLDISPRECAVLVNRKVVKHPCDEYFPFLCERDPEITVSTRLWFMEPLTIAFLGVTAFALIFVVLCVGFWLCKSRQRYREKLERRNSIRASIRSNRSLTGFSELGYKRRIERAFETESEPKPAPMKMNGSLDSVEKSASRFSCSLDDSYENTLGDTSSSRVPNGDFSGFGGFRPDAQHENRTADLMARPTFDLTYENQCFVDRSVSRNSNDISRDWSSSTGSTLDMKRSLERETKEQPYHVGPYRQTPSPPLTVESNGGSSRSSNRAPPLETAM